MPRSSFLTGLHAAFGVPRAVVVGVAQRATGGEVADVQRVVRGYDNEVYRVRLANDSIVYVRIRRPGPRGFYQEAWAMAQARSVDVPVPEVLSIEVVSSEDGDREAMVTEQAPGGQLEDILPSLSPLQRHAAMVEVGRVLAMVHSVRTAGVWRPGEDGVWPDPVALRYGFIADRRAEDVQLSAAGLTADEIRRTVALLGASPDTPPQSEFVLCHGDPTPEHVFVDGHLRVTGFIDWGMWHGGSPIGELARVAAHYEEVDFGSILVGHGAGSLDDPGFRRAISLSIVNQEVGHIAFHVSIGDAEGAARNVAVLRRALNELRGGRIEE